jgi:tyrosine-specific transport protein
MRLRFQMRRGKVAGVSSVGGPRPGPGLCQRTTVTVWRETRLSISSSSSSLYRVGAADVDVDVHVDDTIADAVVSSEEEEHLNQQEDEEEHHTLWGAMALIIGSTIGAGILALPDITQDAGFVPSSVGLVGVWGFLVGQAMLLAEVNISLMERQHEEEEEEEEESRGGRMLTLRAMAEHTLGKGLGKVTTGVYLSLSYCLLVAYLTKVGEIFSFASDGRLHGDGIVDAFVLASLGLFAIGGPAAADSLNQGLTSVLVGVFISILVLGMAGTDLGMLVQHGGSMSDSLHALGPAIPIMFLSLVYHDLIPLICSYLGGDRTKIRKALVFGSLVPLVMFVSWEGVSLAFFNTYMSHHHDISPSYHIDPVNVLISESGNPLIGNLVQGFSFIAIATSFLGTTMGVSETIRSELHTALESGKEKISFSNVFQEEDMSRNIALGLTLLPPLVWTTTGDPKAFINVLSVAGGYGMTLLYGIFPPMMAHKSRGMMNKDTHVLLLPGGNVMLGGLFGIACGLGLYRLLGDVLS